MQPVFSQNRVHQAFQGKSPVQEPSLASAFSPWWWGGRKPSVPAPMPVGVITVGVIRALPGATRGSPTADLPGAAADHPGAAPAPTRRRHTPEEFSAQERNPGTGLLPPLVNMIVTGIFPKIYFPDFNQGKIAAGPP
jgi:hypothetical protein